MKRRGFLKLCGLTIGAGALGTLLPGPADAGPTSGPQSVGDSSATASASRTARVGGGAVAFKQRLFRVGEAGTVLHSLDGGSTWSVHSNFGPEIAVNRLDVTGKRLRAQLGHFSEPFSLTMSSTDDHWRT